MKVLFFMWKWGKNLHQTSGGMHESWNWSQRALIQSGANGEVTNQTWKSNDPHGSLCYNDHFFQGIITNGQEYFLKISSQYVTIVMNAQNLSFQSKELKKDWC